MARLSADPVVDSFQEEQGHGLWTQRNSWFHRPLLLPFGSIARHIGKGDSFNLGAEKIIQPYSLMLCRVWFCLCFFYPGTELVKQLSDSLICAPIPESRGKDDVDVGHSKCSHFFLVKRLGVLALESLRLQIQHQFPHLLIVYVAYLYNRISYLYSLSFSCLIIQMGAMSVTI